MAEAGGVAEGFGDEVFCAADGFDGCVAEDEEAEEGGGEGAAGSVGGGGMDVRADEAVDFAGGEAEDVGGLGAVAGGDDDVEMRVAGGEDVGGGFGVGQVGDGESGKGGELGPVGRDPGDGGEKLLVEGFEGLGWEEVGAGAGAEDGVEDDGSVELLAGLAFEGSEKGRDCSGDFRRTEHTDLDAGGWEVGDQVVEGAGEKGRGDGMDLRDAERGLDGEGGEGGGAEEPVGGKGLEIGGNSGAAGGIVARNGEQSTNAGGGRSAKGRQWRQP